MLSNCLHQVHWYFGYLRHVSISIAMSHRVRAAGDHQGALENCDKAVQYMLLGEAMRRSPAFTSDGLDFPPMYS